MPSGIALRLEQSLMSMYFKETAPDSPSGTASSAGKPRALRLLREVRFSRSEGRACTPRHLSRSSFFKEAGRTSGGSSSLLTG